MTKNEWLQIITDNLETLSEFVAGYGGGKEVEDMPITAPTVEKVRKGLLKGLPQTSNLALKEALIAEDDGVLYSIFQRAWLGVPESRDCWKIPGFSLVCDLLGDPPEYETD